MTQLRRRLYAMRKPATASHIAPEASVPVGTTPAASSAAAPTRPSERDWYVVCSTSLLKARSVLFFEPFF